MSLFAPVASDLRFSSLSCAWVPTRGVVLVPFWLFKPVEVTAMR